MRRPAGLPGRLGRRRVVRRVRSRRALHRRLVRGDAWRLRRRRALPHARATGRLPVTGSGLLPSNLTLSTTLTPQNVAKLAHFMRCFLSLLFLNMKIQIKYSHGRMNHGSIVKKHYLTLPSLFCLPAVTIAYA